MKRSFEGMSGCRAVLDCVGLDWRWTGIGKLCTVHSSWRCVPGWAFQKDNTDRMVMGASAGGYEVDKDREY